MAWTKQIMSHLWEAKHSYYCNQGNYFAREFSDGSEIGGEFETWADFIEEFGDADMDFNLLFRWDWHEGEDHELEEFNDVNHRNGEFLVFWVGPRVFDCSDRAQRHS
jgi:hypothetical protein